MDGDSPWFIDASRLVAQCNERARGPADALVSNESIGDGCGISRFAIIVSAQRQCAARPRSFSTARFIDTAMDQSTSAHRHLTVVDDLPRHSVALNSSSPRPSIDADSTDRCRSTAARPPARKVRTSTRCTRGSSVNTTDRQAVQLPARRTAVAPAFRGWPDDALAPRVVGPGRLAQATAIAWLK